MALLILYFQTCASDLMIFTQMLEIVALSDFASVLCAGKFSFASQGGCFKYPSKFAFLVPKSSQTRSLFTDFPIIEDNHQRLVQITKKKGGHSFKETTKLYIYREINSS